MTTPPDDFENDPTGMRDLLRSLPGPGPMPQDVADRITAAMAEEQHARDGADHDNVTPLTRPERAAARSSAQRRWLRAAGGLVAAAAVAAVAVVGVNSLRHDNAPTSAVPSTGHRIGPDQLAGRVNVRTTGTNYSSGAFNTQAASMASGDASSVPDAALLAEFGSLARPQAIAQCARSIGGALLDDPSSVKVNLASFDGKPALIVVVTNKGKRSAFAVSSSCSEGAKPYAAPRAI